MYLLMFTIKTFHLTKKIQKTFAVLKLLITFVAPISLLGEIIYSINLFNCFTNLKTAIKYKSKFPKKFFGQQTCQKQRQHLV